MIREKQDLNQYSWRMMCSLLLSVVALMLPEFALANNAADTQISNTLCNVVNWLNGSTGRAIATIAIIVVGVMALAGRLNWSMAIIVVAGIALVFGAKVIVQALSGGGTACGGGGAAPPPGPCIGSGCLVP